MFDQWIKQDLDKIYDQHQVAVLIDESRQSQFILSQFKELQIYEAHNEVDELHVKYLIESEQPLPHKVLVYTQSPKSNLKFIREYCETQGHVEIKYLQNYLKDKVHQTLNLNINLSAEELIAAAKVSVGKDRTYWMDLSHKGSSEIFDLEKELLPFLHAPTQFETKYDAQVRETFYRKLSEHLKQDYLKKPVKTLANEVVKVLFESFIQNDVDPLLMSVYKTWLDSRSYKTSFDAYLKQYSLPHVENIWQVSSAHPFREIDVRWFKEIGQNIRDTIQRAHYLARINERIQNKQAQNLEITFWKDVKVLLEFDPKDIAYLDSLDQCISFYTRHFYQLDNAIRNLYTEFLNDSEIIEPFQSLYKSYVDVFLDKWFKYLGDYKQNQTGILQRIIDENDCKTAIIVGDGVAYEIAQNIVHLVDKDYKVNNNVILADWPSETENNMSQIYKANGEVEKVHQKREQYLSAQNPDKNIGFVYLDQLSENTEPYQYMICTYKDIDDMGEKLQQKFLKYLPESEAFFAKQIEFLLENGYRKVYLLTDHGFVLTGILNESEKIAVDFTGKTTKSERYIRTVDKQEFNTKELVEYPQGYGEYQYLYFSKTLHPFKTPGVYGFSHGGLAPQELITPFICWENTAPDHNSISVAFTNKGDLQNVTGELYTLKVEAKAAKQDIFSENRKVYLVFMSDGQQISASDILTLKDKDTLSKDYAFDGRSIIDVQLLDAQTKELLDRVQVKKNSDRDLGGLF